MYYYYMYYYLHVLLLLQLLEQEQSNVMDANRQCDATKKETRKQLVRNVGFISPHSIRLTIL